MTGGKLRRIIGNLRATGQLASFDICGVCHQPYGDDDRRLTADDRGLVVHTRCARRTAFTYRSRQ